MISIGDRVSSVSYEKIGTICSIITNESSELLYGIEWDAKSGAESGRKPHRTIEEPEFYSRDQIITGISFQNAVIDRYLSEDINSEFFVGLKKAHEYCRRLSSLSLEKMNVSFCLCHKLRQNNNESITSEIPIYFKNIESVYLNDNLISDWKTVYCILSHLTNIKYLILNGNRLSRNSEQMKQIFGNVKVLSLRKTNVEFKQVIDMCSTYSVFPNVEHINVSSNDYLSLDVNGKNNTIKIIDISNNIIDDWEMFRVKILDNFTKLTSINISNNNFTNIPKIDSDSVTDYAYENVTELIMDECGLESLNSILYLSRIFPNLRQISLRDNEVLNGNRDFDVRSIIISLFPNIQIYNKSIIKQEDIVSSQRYYISQYLVHMNKSLREIDPKSEILLYFMSKNITCNLEDVGTENKHYKDKYIELKFSPKFKQSVDPISAIKINKKITISDIKMLISKLYRIPRNESLQLIFVNGNSNIEINKYRDTFTLSDIGVEESGDILIFYDAK